jgi:hypothetical protein
MSIGNINCIAKEDVGSANVYHLPLNLSNLLGG